MPPCIHCTASNLRAQALCDTSPASVTKRSEIHVKGMQMRTFTEVDLFDVLLMSVNTCRINSTGNSTIYVAPLSLLSRGG